MQCVEGGVSDMICWIAVAGSSTPLHSTPNMVVVYSTSPKLLFAPRYSKSRLLAVLSCPQFNLTFSRPCSASRYKKLIRCVRSRSAADDPNESSGGRTRLIRTIQAFQLKLSARLRVLTKDLPVKLFSFLVGFYCATAFATVIGQTGDWDVLSAALTVAVVEGIGALMYKASLPLVDSLKNFIIISNYWKAGLSLGLFLDSFKYLDYRMSNSFVKERILLPASRLNAAVMDVYRIASVGCVHDPEPEKQMMLVLLLK